MMELSNRIKSLRTGFHLSQDYIAKYLGISCSSVNKMEEGKREITTREIDKLCSLYGINPKTLLKGSH